MPVTWENYPGETPILSGGQAVGKGGLGLTWKHTSANLWQVQLPGNVGKPTDFLLTKNPVAGFDYTRTDDTIRHAGRDHPLIHPPKVPHTFPTYTFTEF